MNGTVFAGSHRTAIVGLVSAAACWGSTVVLISIAARGLSVLAITIIEALSAIVLLGLVVSVRGVALGRPTRVLVLAGLLEPGLAYPLINAGVSRTSGTHAALIIGLESVAIVAFAAAGSRSRPKARTVLALVLAVAGAALLNGDHDGGADVRGDALVGLGVLTAAGYVVLVQTQSARFDGLTLTFYQFLFGLGGVLAVAVFIFAVHPSRDVLWTGRPSAGQWTAAVATGVLGSAIAFALYNAALSRVSTTSAATSLCLIPIFGVAFSVMFLGDGLSWQTFLATALVLCGVILAARTSAVGEPSAAAGPPTAQRRPAE